MTWTHWSVAGAPAAVALIVLLAARGPVRVAVRPDVRRLRPLRRRFWCALPLPAVVLAPLEQRFLTVT